MGSVVDKVVLCERDGGQGGYFARLCGSKTFSEEGVCKTGSVVGVPETRPEPGGTQKVKVDISIVSHPAETMDIRLGGVRRKRERNSALLLPIPSRYCKVNW